MLFAAVSAQRSLASLRSIYSTPRDAIDRTSDATYARRGGCKTGGECRASIQRKPSGHSDRRPRRRLARRQIVRGAGFGLIGDLVVGIVGAFIGDWLLPRVGIHLGTGIISSIVNALIGAIILLFLIRLVSGAGFGYRRRW